MAAVPSGTQRGRARPLGWRGRVPWVERTGQSRAHVSLKSPGGPAKGLPGWGAGAFACARPGPRPRRQTRGELWRRV